MIKIIEPKISVCPYCKVQDPSFIISVEPNKIRCSCALCGYIITFKNKIIVKKEADNGQ